MSGFLGEFFGTFVLILFGVGIGASVTLKKTHASGSNWHYITFAWGLAFAFAIYVAGHLGSEAHLNPVVTLSFAAFGKFPWSQVAPYILAQFLGAFAGAAIVIVHYYPQFKETKTAEEGNNVGIFATGGQIRSNFFNFCSEAIATFALVFVLLNLGDFSEGLKPFIIGLLVMVIGQALGGATGFAMNPARDWAPRFAYTILPVPNKTTADWAYAWVPFVGPLVGSLVATGLQTLIM